MSKMAVQEIPAGSHGYMSTDGTTGGAFLAFTVNTAGSQITWIYKSTSNDWPGGVSNFSIVYGSIDTSSWGGTPFTTSDTAFGGSTTIPSGDTNYEGTVTVSSTDYTLVLKIVASDSFAWYVASGYPNDYLPEQTTAMASVDPVPSGTYKSALDS